MKIYDDATKLELQQPDLNAGYLYDGVRVVGTEPEHYEVMPGTVTEDRPEGLRRRVRERAITEPCWYYHAYTPEELAARNTPTDAERMDALESAVAELAELLAE